MYIANEPLTQLFTSSRLLILDFREIPDNIPADQSIQQYFEDCHKKGIDPRTPALRQEFNNSLLAQSGKRYLIGRYGEDRSSMLRGSSIAKEQRTIHLGVDIFCRDLETVYAPCDGKVVRVGNEPENHSFGHFMIIRPDDASLPYIFFGHLAPDMVKKGRVEAGQAVGSLGDYHNHENGGWSRHLHLQMLRSISPKGPPVGYASGADFVAFQKTIPNPLAYFPEWKIEGIDAGN